MVPPLETFRMGDIKTQTRHILKKTTLYFGLDYYNLKNAWIGSQFFFLHEGIVAPKLSVCEATAKIYW